MQGQGQKEAEEANRFKYLIKNDPEEVKKHFKIENDELLTDIEREAGLDIMAEYQKKLNDLESFMASEYMNFSAKIDRCLLNHCYKNIYQPRSVIKQCVFDCTQGIKRADTFVADKFNLFTTSFGECLETAQKSKKNTMQEVFECYDTMLNTFDSLKREIRKEFSYYE